MIGLPETMLYLSSFECGVTVPSYFPYRSIQFFGGSVATTFSCCGGDAVTGAATVILAMGAGKAGAKGIDEYLKNK